MKKKDIKIPVEGFDNIHAKTSRSQNPNNYEGQQEGGNHGGGAVNGNAWGNQTRTNKSVNAQRNVDGDNAHGRK